MKTEKPTETLVYLTSEGIISASGKLICRAVDTTTPEYREALRNSPLAKWFGEEMDRVMLEHLAPDAPKARIFFRDGAWICMIGDYGWIGSTPSKAYSIAIIRSRPPLFEGVFHACD